MKISKLSLAIKLSAGLLIILNTFWLSSCTGHKNKKAGETVTDSLNVKQDTVDISTLNMLIRRDPTNASLFARRAKMQSTLKKNDEAINDISIALRLDSLVPGYYIQQSEYYVVAGRPNSAKNSLNRGLKLFPDNVDLMLKLAEIHFYLKEYGRAKIILNNVMSIDDDNPQLYFLNGLISAENKDTSGAIRYFKTAIEKDPDFYAAYMQTGRLMAAQNNDMAMQYYQSAIDLTPESYEARYHLALYSQEHSHLDEALSQYDYIIHRIDSTVAFPYFNKGYIDMIYKKDFDQAIQWFTRALSYKPDYTEAYYNRGFCYEISGKYKRAKEDYNACLKLAPNYPLAIKGLNRIDDGKPIKIKK